MKILYDFQAFTWQKFGGVSNCFAKLIANLPKETDYEIAIRETDNLHLLESSITEVSPCSLTGDNFLTKKFFPGKYRLYNYFTALFPRLTSCGKNMLTAKYALERGDYDIFHPTFFNSYFLKYIGEKPFVLTIHDMIPELVYESKNDPQIAAKQLLAPKAAKIVAVSENTKHDVVKLLGVREEKVSVVYHGAPEDMPFDSKPMFPFAYVLFVGGRNLSYKNFKPMVKSIAPIMKCKRLHLVCTGAVFTKEEEMLFHELNISELVHHKFCSEKELMNLYHNALCFIFPSLYEGFGMPILEAYKAGCPVMLNEKSCFPEIAGDAAVFFRLDEKADTLSDKLSEFVNCSSGFRDSLLNKQKERLKLYSWRKSAERLSEVYKSMLS